MSSLTTVYIVTVIISIALGLLLIHMARLSGQVKVNQERKELGQEYLDSQVHSDEALKQLVYDEISDVVSSKHSREEISNKVSGIFAEEINKRVVSGIKDMNKKFETVLEQKSQSEEIAWQKYNKIFTDKKQTESVIRSIAEGLLVVDADGKVLMMNPAAEKLLGISKRDKIGRPLLENIKEEQLVSLVRGGSGPVGKGDREIELVSSQDETKKVLRASSAVIEDENGKTVGMVSVLSDITKQKELDQLKSTFVANVSHELRTPLVAMEKSIALILNKSAGDITANQEQFLVIAERNLKRLSLLINDLLDLSKLEAGMMELKTVNNSIERVIVEAVESLETWAKTKSIAIEKNIQKGLPQIYIDADRITQVLNNLLGNSIKFTPNQGTIVVEARLSNESGSIEVSVKDDGIGIAQEDVTHVFEKFYQSGERISTDISGTGIGLSITKEIIELHGGKIWVESVKGQGAKFFFTLPLKNPGSLGG